MVLVTVFSFLFDGQQDALFAAHKTIVQMGVESITKEVQELYACFG